MRRWSAQIQICAIEARKFKIAPMKRANSNLRHWSAQIQICAVEARKFKFAPFKGLKFKFAPNVLVTHSTSKPVWATASRGNLTSSYIILHHRWHDFFVPRFEWKPSPYVSYDPSCLVRYGDHDKHDNDYVEWGLQAKQSLIQPWI